MKKTARGLGRLFVFLGLRDLGFVGKFVGMSTLIGVCGGLAAVVFERLLHGLREIGLERAIQLSGEGLGEWTLAKWPILVILPLGGLIVGLLTWYIAPEAEGHGTEQVIRAFHQLGGRVRRRVIALKALTSAITIGTGGSAGQEGPVAQIGSGVGSIVSNALKLSDRDRRIFLLAGSSAGIGALFTAPMGGALFAPEVVYRKPEFEGEAIIPCIISSIVAYTTFTAISGDKKAIPIPTQILEGLSMNDPREMGIYLVLAILCTLVSWAYVHFFDRVRSVFNSSKVPGPLRPAVGGLLLALLAIGIAPFCGEHGVLFGGYELMKASISGDLALKTLLILVVAKILATSFSISTGGSGGVFAPSLAIGAMLGAIVGKTAAGIFPDLALNPASYALVGMGGFFAGVAKTPIASILIVCEMTGSYELLAPLMLVSVVHLLFSSSWTIYDTQVGGIVESPAHAGDFVIDVLERMQVTDLMASSRKPVTIQANTTLRRALDIVSKAQGYYYPVVDKEDQLVGIFSLTDVRRIFQEMEVADIVIVRDFMIENVVTVTQEDTVNQALSKLNEYGLHEIPVVDEETGRTVLAMLTRNNIGATYHKRLHALKQSESS